MSIVIKKGLAGIEDMNVWTAASPTFSRTTSSAGATTLTSVSASGIPLQTVASVNFSALNVQRAITETTTRFIDPGHSIATYTAGASPGDHKLVFGFKNANAATSIQAAASNQYLSDGVARIVLPQGTVTVATPIQLPRKTMIFGNGRSTVIRASGTVQTSRVFSISGSVAATNSALGANATANTSVVSVADGTKFAADDWIIVRGGAASSTATMEMHQIKAISGNDLTIYGKLVYLYRSAATVAHASLVYPAELTMNHLTIRSSSGTQGIGLVATYLVNSHIGSDVHFEGQDTSAVTLKRSSGNELNFSAYNQADSAATHTYAAYLDQFSHLNKVTGRRWGSFKDVANTGGARNYVFGVTWNGNYAASQIDGITQATYSTDVYGDARFRGRIAAAKEIAAAATVSVAGPVRGTSDIEYIGANTPGWISNLGISYAAGVLTIVDAQGTALGTSNPGFVTVPSTTAGQFATLKVTTGQYFNDDAHASSNLTNFGWGITETANWANDMPFFLYAVNRGNADIDGTDGNSAFCIARNFAMSSTPAAAGNIGDLDAIPGTDDQTSILLLGSYTEANYTSLPCQMVGAIRMQWSTATDDWTVQTLGNTDGLGKAQIDKTFAKLWTLPTGQNGAMAGKHFNTADGSTALTFDPTNDVTYTIAQNGSCTAFWYFNSQSAAGADATSVLFCIPYASNSSGPGRPVGSFRASIAGTTTIGAIFITAGGEVSAPAAYQGASVLDSSFSNTNDYFYGTLAYKAY